MIDHDDKAVNQHGCDYQCLLLHLPHLPPRRDNFNKLSYFYHTFPLFKSKSTNQRTTGPVPSKSTAWPHGYNGLFLKQSPAPTNKSIPRTQDRTAYISRRQRLQNTIVTMYSRIVSWSRMSNTMGTVLIDSGHLTAQMAAHPNVVGSASSFPFKPS